MSALDQVLALGVDLQLRDDSLDHVGLVVAGSLWEGDRAHGSVLEFNFEWLVAHLHWLVLEFGLVDFRIPTLLQFAVDASVLGIFQLHLEGVAITRANGELGAHQNSGPLILQVRERCKCAGAHLIVVFLVLVPSPIPTAV